MDSSAIHAWYVSNHRLLELLDIYSLPPQILQALQSPDPAQSKFVLANLLGPQLLSYLRNQNIYPFHRLAAQGLLRPGIPFTYQGHFFGKGFGASNKTPHVSLSENIDEMVAGKKLLIEFSKSGIVTDTAYMRMSGSTNLFAFCSLTEMNEKEIKAVPYLIGDLVDKKDSGIALRFVDYLKLPVEEIDQFANIDFFWNPTATQFNKLRDVPEQKIKELFCELLSEVEVPKDWGGEETDIYSSNLSVKGNRYNAAFLLKGPARFHEMTLADCGKNGDQIYRLFNTPAEVFILQHCHKVTPSVRKTMEAFALSQYSRDCKYTIIDGYDTARILHAHGEL